MGSLQGQGTAAASRLQNLKTATPLTEKDPRMGAPPGFVGRLWAPQETLLKAMVDLEGEPIRPLAFDPGERGESPEPCEFLHCSCARVRAIPSFGKTIVCIALVCHSRSPPQHPTILHHLAMAQNIRQPRIEIQYPSEPRLAGTVYPFMAKGRGFLPTYSVRYRRHIPTTVVIAARSVITQWEQNIRVFAPHLSFFTVDRVTSLQGFYKQFRAGAPPYDILLLKAGTVTANFVVPGEPLRPTTTRNGAAEPPLPKGSTRSLLTAFSMATEGSCWARVIVDDFDMIELAASDVYLPSLFCWVVSATDRVTRLQPASFKERPTVAEFIRANLSVPILTAGSHTLLQTALCLQCDDAYLRAHLETTALTYRRICVVGGRAAGILEGLGYPDEVIEMAAAGAVSTAAQRLNIEAATVADLIARVLATPAGLYRQAVRALSRIERARASAAASGAPADDQRALEAFEAVVQTGSEEEFEQALGRLGAPSQMLYNVLEALTDWASSLKELHGGRLRRMRENISQNACQACLVPISADSGAFIVNCCQTLVCDFCISRPIERGGSLCRFIRRCPHCTLEISPKKQIIYIGPDVEIEQALSDEALLTSGAEGAEGAAAESLPQRGAAAHSDPRLQALCQLILNRPIDCLGDALVPPFVEGLLEGRQTVPHPAGALHRYLVFAMYPESVKRITAAFEAEGVLHSQIIGTRQHKDRAVSSFKSGETSVLLATSSRDCSGLHLPEVTRLVLYHHHRDPKITEQCVGRAQRVGRTSSLEVIELLDQEEARRLN